MSDDFRQEDTELDLTEALGAGSGTSHQLLTLYIPNKDRDDQEFGTQRKWVLEAAQLLARIGGGVTIMPPTEGGWFDTASDRIIWENPVVVYTYINPQAFLHHLPALRSLLHRMGQMTNQGEVAVEFDGQFYRITDYDTPGEDS